MNITKGIKQTNTSKDLVLFLYFNYIDMMHKSSTNIIGNCKNDNSMNISMNATLNNQSSKDLNTFGINSLRGQINQIEVIILQ